MSQASRDQREKLEQRWNEIRADIQARWPQLSDDEIRMIGGDSRKLVALVHQKTDAPISEIEDAIDQIAARSDGLLARVVRSAGEFARMANHQVTAPLNSAMQHTQQSITGHPMMWLVGSFAAGMLLGLTLGERRR